ncbi:MAG: serine hydrolase, partial [Candidatus Abyssubacteria bacterium]|nr:serine hydrolase [Candidatus Abyssubacteria bacterium]
MSPAAEPRKKKWPIVAILILVFFGLVVCIIARVNLGQMWEIYTFFDEGKRIENFRHTERVFPVRGIRRSDPQYHFARDIRELNTTYGFKGETRKVNEFLARTVTTGFLVVKDDKIVTERYFHGATEDTLMTSMSVVKSFVSALVGIAIDDGLIEGVDRPITDYVPKLKGSGYDGVPIKHVLQMSSGVKFDEVYDDTFSDINLLFYKVFGLGQSLDDYMANLKPEYPSGETSYYRSCDTQALGMLVSTVTGKTVSAYLEEKIWGKIGMEYDASWCIDQHGTEISFAFLNAALRDYAKFGMLYLHEGNWNGEQIISQSWVRESVVPDNPNLQPGRKPEGFETFGTFGYQYQWWIPDHPDEEFMALGV